MVRLGASQKKEWIECCITVAAKNGQFEIVKYLFYKLDGKPWHLFNATVESDYLEMVQWISERFPSRGKRLSDE